MATVEDYRRHTAYALAQPCVFGMAHVRGKALIFKNGQGLGPFQPDFDAEKGTDLFSASIER